MRLGFRALEATRTHEGHERARGAGKILSPVSILASSFWLLRQLDTDTQVITAGAGMGGSALLFVLFII